jgi:protein-tyrosine kinase
VAALDVSTAVDAVRDARRRLLGRARSTAPPLTAALPPTVVEACRYASLQLGGPRLRSLGVTSSIRGEGRSTIVHALTLVQREDYQRRPVLVDLDLERPELTGRLGGTSSPGLAELAAGLASIDEVLQPLGGGITLVSAGAGDGPPARTMAAILGTGVLASIEERFDVLVADLPPLLASGFGQAPLTAFADVLLVVRGGVTPLDRIRQATAHLPVQPRVLLNDTRSSLPPWVRRLAGC